MITGPAPAEAAFIPFLPEWLTWMTCVWLLIGAGSLLIIFDIEILPRLRTYGTRKHRRRSGQHRIRYRHD